MVAMLPLVGTGLGLITCLVWLAVSWLGGPGLDAVMFTGAAEGAQTLPPGFTGAIHPVLTGAVITAAYFPDGERVCLITSLGSSTARCPL